MRRHNAEQARRLSAFIDGLIVSRRTSDDAPDLTYADRELEELHRLVQPLTDAHIDPPVAFRDELLARLPYLARTESPADLPPPRFARVRRWLRWFSRSIAPDAVRKALSAAALAALVILGLVRLLRDAPIASAEEIVGRSDAALTSLARSDQLLYRRWKVTSTIVSAARAT